MLYRGTTPYHNFLLPLKAEDIDKIYITYMQNGEILFERSKDSIEITNIENPNSNGFITDTNLGDDLTENNAESSEEFVDCSQATVHLSQEETLKFKFYPAAEKNIAIIQIRVLAIDGEAFDSEVIRERVYGVLKDGVI